MSEVRRVFVDTNIVLYMLSLYSAKAERARQIVNGGCVISVQVLNEACNVMLRKQSLPWSDVRSFLALLRQVAEVASIDLMTHEIALNISERYRFSIYDAMIVAAAIQSGCDTVYSEDMQDGQSIDGLVRIVNPFRQTP